MSKTFQTDPFVYLDTEESKIRVSLARGGHQFPWAVHRGKILTGPPDGTNTSDGVPLCDLHWHYNTFWVVEATNEKMEPVDLTPEQYQEAVERAELLSV